MRQSLSPPQRPLCIVGMLLCCVVGRLGRKKKRARGARWEGGRERFLFLSIIDILMGIPSGSLCGGERDSRTSRYVHLSNTDTSPLRAASNVPTKFSYIFFKKNLYNTDSLYRQRSLNLGPRE